MEAVWKLEDKWNLSTKQAFFLLLFAAASTVTAATFLRRLKSRKAPAQKHDIIIASDSEECSPEMTCGWVAVKAALTGRLRWSRPRRWSGSSNNSSGSGSSSSSWRETPLPLIEKGARSDGCGAATWRGEVAESPVWQRPILMGGKCELPRFSGLILYDENGQPCDDVARREIPCTNVPLNEEKITPKAVRTTLRDLL